MASIYLFTPQNLEAPQLTSQQLGLGPVQVYSWTSTFVEAGFGPQYQLIDYDFYGYGFGGQSPVVTDVDGYFDNSIQLTIEGIYWPLKSITDDIFGQPLGATGIFAGDDVFYGSYGNDVMFGYEGNDEIHGNTDGYDVGDHDILWGGPGADTIYGGNGHNTFLWERDGSVDTIILENDGMADIIYSIDAFDTILIMYVYPSEVGFAPVEGGIGIFARGLHAATYVGGDLTADQLQRTLIA